MIIITISLKIITISIFREIAWPEPGIFEQVSAAAITAKIMEKNMSGCEKRNAIGCEKAKCGGLRKGEIGRRERGTFCPHCAADFCRPRCAVDFFAARIALSTFLPPAVRWRFFAARIALSTFVVRIARGYVAARIALSTFAARGARLCCRPRCQEDCLEGCYQTGKKIQGT